MKTDLENQLKALSRAAKAERLVTEAKQQAQRKAQVEDVNFSQAMTGVTPLKSRNQFHHPQDTSPIKVRSQNEVDLDAADYFYVGDTEHQEPPPVFSKNGRGTDDIRRLQAKHWPMVGYVDLHGYRQDEAQEVLNEFLAYVQKRGVCGEIVHGSGLGSKDYAPVLKHTVRRWLMAHPQVLAYAQPNERNDGAVYVLLKQRRRDHDES